MEKNTAEIITQVIVDPNDPAFKNPNKFIGPPLTKNEATRLMNENPEYCAKFYKNAENPELNSHRASSVNTHEPLEIWRRVVPSPKPIGIVEIDMIEACYLSGHIPITVGGGGIPVVQVSPQKNKIMKHMSATTIFLIKGQFQVENLKLKYTKALKE